MQGLEVSGMIVWSIYRTEDGPMRAYKNLGESLMDLNSVTANEKLVSMCGAIVRNCIANSTINEILTNRAMIRKAVREGVSEVVKGWGMWIETIEVTDVKILSSSLFADLQCKFREEQKQSAEMNALNINDQIETVKLQSNIKMNENRSNAKMAMNLFNSQRQLELKDGQSLCQIEQTKIDQDR